MTTETSRVGSAWVAKNRLARLGMMFVIAGSLVGAARSDAPAKPPGRPANQVAYVRGFSCEAVRLAIRDLLDTHDSRYPRGEEFLARLAELERSRQAFLDDFGATTPSRGRKAAVPLARDLRRLKQEALLANPLLDFDRLIFLKRKRGQLGLPTNHQCNSCLDQAGYENEIGVLSPVRPGGKLGTLFRPEGGFYVGEIDLAFDGDRLLFAMPNGRTWQIHEIGVDGTGLRQVSREEDSVDNFDPCYLPDGRIVFASTACFTAVPCWHGKERACSLYVMNADGSGVRQLCFDQDLDLHPAVLPTGQVIYSRWDYTGIMHFYFRPLMVMNPDGTSQRAVYGSNSYYPNSLFYPRGVPGSPNKLAAILSGYHGVNRMGELVLLDTTEGWFEADGIMARIGHRGEPAVPIVRDALVNDSWPKFLHPAPLSEKYFLTAAQTHGKAPWGIYLVDVFDNMLPLVLDPKLDLFEPLPVRATARPPAIPNRVDTARDDAVVYLHNIYAGPGLAGVPRGTVKRLRIAAYHFGYPGMAGPDKIGRGGPWDSMRILGTVPVAEDGSVAFRVPANTPLTVQPLDAEGKALQWMRSWYTAMPGETAACVGCHEQPSDTPTPRREMAALGTPREIEPWYGPARGFDFEREVQPVLDALCVRCHDGNPRPDGQTIPDLRSERFASNYQGSPLTKLGANRMAPELRARFFSHTPEHEFLGSVKMRYTPAYEALIPYIRRVNVEDYVGLHVPGEYHADTSELVQMLQKGHHDVSLDREAWDRLVTWIDLNGPCHGTWGDVSGIPRRADRKRRKHRETYGGPKEDPEAVPEVPPYPAATQTPRVPETPVLARLPGNREVEEVALAGWPFDALEARRRQRHGRAWERTVDLGSGIRLNLVRIPSGSFVMGDPRGEVDERPAAEVPIDRDFWMSTCEISNEQLRRFDPGHHSGLFMKRSLDPNGPGISMNEPEQPAVRVSWEKAVAFCGWLSGKTGSRFRLPTEAEWEYACRAGTSTGLGYGEPASDFSPHGNLADQTIDRLFTGTGGVIVLQDIPCEMRYNDNGLATVDVGSYRCNAWGLFDMHGNAAEWTLSTKKSYPYRPGDGRNQLTPEGPKVVRGGSFHDRPKRCRSAYRLSYPAWQRVHNVGFRVMCEATPARGSVVDRR